MKKFIAVIAEISQFAVVAKYFTNEGKTIDRIEGDFFEINNVQFLRIDKPNHNSIESFQWSGYFDGFDWIDAGQDLVDCMDVFEKKGVPLVNVVMLLNEVE
jgi:hypothetical protein